VLEEMADAIAFELNVTSNNVLSVLNQYWQDKIAHVWQVDDMLESARRTGKPITHADAAGLLHNLFDQLDSSMGISRTNLDVALEDYHFSLKNLPDEKYSEVYGIFKVWRKSNLIAHQFGMAPKMMDGNLPDALALAKTMAKEIPGVSVFIGLETDVDEDSIPWLTIILPVGETEPVIEESGDSCTQ
ncbi:MAG: hypothetical protein HY863_20915, partial [Chloroflexi bacterium]|nr:hypothetical protein [Chloroflexota bacterium]